MIIEPLTPLQESISLTGRRYFKTNSFIYEQLCIYIDNIREFPDPNGYTLRSLPLVEDTIKAEDNDILISVEIWRMTSVDDAILLPHIEENRVIELTIHEYNQLLPIITL